MKKQLVLGGICLAVACILGCSGPAPSSETTGSVILIIGAEGLGARTITPGVVMEVATYDIQGTGPDAATFGGTGLTGLSHEWNELAQGQWTVRVEARNGDGIRIAAAAQGFVIAGGETTTVSLAVVPLPGPGTLAISISWPASAIAAPAIAASVAPEEGSPSTLPFTINGNTATCSSSAIEAGYYALTMRLLDGSSLVWGRTEAVRVLAGEITAASYPLTLADINDMRAGTLSLEVAVELSNPAEITLSGIQALLASGTDMTATACTAAPQDSWQWYLNGELVPGADGESIAIGSALSPGHYWLDVMARKGAVLSSAHGFFGVDTQSQATAPSVGEIIINEIMMDPAGVADTSGEWFELYNVTGKQLDIEGLVVRSASQFVRFGNSGAGVIVQPGEYFVLCRNGDPALNGQVVGDYPYGSGISLPNSGGSLTIAGFGTNGMDGIAIDTAHWTSSVPGKSWSLKTSYRNAVDNDSAGNWYWAAVPYSASDMGTPGAANEQ